MKQTVILEARCTLAGQEAAQWRPVEVELIPGLYLTRFAGQEVTFDQSCVLGEETTDFVVGPFHYTLERDTVEIMGGLIIVPCEGMRCPGDERPHHGPLTLGMSPKGKIVAINGYRLEQSVRWVDGYAGEQVVWLNSLGIEYEVWLRDLEDAFRAVRKSLPLVSPSRYTVATLGATQAGGLNADAAVYALFGRVALEPAGAGILEPNG